MINPDSYYDNIGNMMQMAMTGINTFERAREQHIGKIYNKTFSYSGKLADDVLANIDRIIAGQKKHGFEQNKVTDLEKLRRKGEENAGY